MDNGKQVWTWIIVAIVVILGGWWLLGNKTTDAGPIKIGVITPLSGDAGSLGEIIKNVAELAASEINKDGGVNGQQIKLVYEDDQCDPKLSVSAAQKLITVDQVKIIIGSTCSGGVLSMLPVTDQNKVFVFSSSATSPALTGKSLLFARTVASDASQGKLLAEAAIARGWKKVAVVQESSDGALGIFNAFQANYPATSGTIVKEEFPSSTTDFRSILTKLKASSPDAIFFIPQSPTTGQMLMTNLSQTQWNVHVMVGDMIGGNAGLVLANKQALEGAITAEQSSDTTNQKYQILNKKYKELYGKEIMYTAYVQAQYDALYILSEGVKKFGNDPVRIAAWVRTIKDWDGASGKLTIDQNGDRVGGYALEVIRDGKVTKAQ